MARSVVRTLCISVVLLAIPGSTAAAQATPELPTAPDLLRAVSERQSEMLAGVQDLTITQEGTPRMWDRVKSTGAGYGSSSIRSGAVPSLGRAAGHALLRHVLDPPFHRPRALASATDGADRTVRPRFGPHAYGITIDRPFGRALESSV